MDKTRLASSLRERLLLQLGGKYILVVVALAQLLAFPGIALGAIPIQINAQFTPEQLIAGTWLILPIVLAGNLGLLFFAYWISPHAYARLNSLARNLPLVSGLPEELAAWSEITSITWKYGVGAAIVSIFLDIAPLVIYQRFFINPEIRITNDQAIYSLLGGTLSAIAIVLIVIFVLETMLEPARGVLLPKNSEMQLAGAAGFKLNAKYIGAVSALILISVLLIAPAGYRQTYRAIYETLQSELALNQTRLQFIILAMVVLALGVAIAYFLASSVSRPVIHLIEVFKKIEGGDLKQRASLLSADEIGELTIYFNRMVTRLEALQHNLEQQVAARTAQLRATNEVGRIASAILEPDTLIAQTVNLITDRFGYYYAAIFLVDESGAWAELKDATGTVGATLKAQRHRLQIGGKSMVGSAISTQQPRVSQNVNIEGYRFNNPLLPETRSEIAVPLMVGERSLGALDVQSTDEDAFDPETIDTLKNMASQVAIALENARLFQATRQSLEEIRSIHQQYMINAWAEKMRVSELQYTSDAPGLPAGPMGQANTINVPLTLRDQSLGTITLETENDWDPEQKAWAEAVATQVAISLENARLIEESQQAALRERLAAAITEKIWSSTSIDGILQTTARELGRSLEATEVVIELKIDEGKKQ